MTPALDEVSTEYGLLAEAVSHPDDHSSVTYRLRANARWHDGKPVTPDDVIFSFDAFKANSPHFGAYYRHVTKVGEDRRARDHLHLRRAGQPRVAADRRPAAGPAEALVGRHRQVRQQSATSRRPRWSRRSAPGRTGSRSSLRAARSSTRRSPTIGARTSMSSSAREIFSRSATNISAIPRSRWKASRATSWIGALENSAKDWATAYDFPAVRDKRVVLEEFPIRNRGVMQAFVSISGATNSRIRACAAHSISPSISRK